MAWKKDDNYIAGVKVPRLNIKNLTDKRLKLYEQRIQDIKDACSRLKNSAVSKNDALKEIKNICNNMKLDEEQMWKDIINE